MRHLSHDETLIAISLSQTNRQKPATVVHFFPGVDSFKKLIQDDDHMDSPSGHQQERYPVKLEAGSSVYGSHPHSSPESSVHPGNQMPAASAIAVKRRKRRIITLSIYGEAPEPPVIDLSDGDSESAAVSSNITDSTTTNNHPAADAGVFDVMVSTAMDQETAEPTAVAEHAAPVTVIPKRMPLQCNQWSQLSQQDVQSGPVAAHWKHRQVVQ